MRQIVIDTETTGLEPEKGHRIIEIGCVELLDRKVTDNIFHRYINPEREVEAEALAVHGITNDFLKDKPVFAIVIDELIDFIRDAELIAHNASFDIGFINYEIHKISKNRKLLDSYVSVFDTLALARKKFPGQRNTLDAICKRYKIDLSGRKLHGALLDAQLLAEAYLLMTGGQSTLFTEQIIAEDVISQQAASATQRSSNNYKLTTVYADTQELTEHQNLLAALKKNSRKCLWQN